MAPNSNPNFEEVEEEDIWVNGPKASDRKAPPPPQHPSLVALFETAITQGRTLVEAQIELTKLKAKATFARLIGSIISLLVVIVLVFYFIWWTFHTIEVALRLGVPEWAASLITWGILLLLMGALGGIGVLLAKRAQAVAPNPMSEIDDDISAVKKGLSK